MKLHLHFIINIDWPLCRVLVNKLRHDRTGTAGEKTQNAHSPSARGPVKISHTQTWRAARESRLIALVYLMSTFISPDVRGWQGCYHVQNWMCLRGVIRGLEWWLLYTSSSPICPLQCPAPRVGSSAVSWDRPANLHDSRLPLCCACAKTGQ